MKVGDYVRSDKGIIAKITNINKTGSIVCDRNIYYGFNVVSNKRVLCDLSKIIKSSPNIIDLIEVGDYVNGRKVSKINLDMTFNKEKSILCGDFDYDCLETIYTNEDIKSILTKEQFESMEYRIGE